MSKQQAAFNHEPANKMPDLPTTSGHTNPPSAGTNENLDLSLSQRQEAIAKDCEHAISDFEWQFTRNIRECGENPEAIILAILIEIRRFSQDGCFRPMPSDFEELFAVLKDLEDELTPDNDQRLYDEIVELRRFHAKVQALDPKHPSFKAKAKVKKPGNKSPRTKSNKKGA